jgi:hypothetical protein
LTQPHLAAILDIQMHMRTRNRIFRVDPLSLPARVISALMVRRVGFLPGIMAVLLPDLRLLWKVTQLFAHVHMRRSSRLSILQREMVATVVNGAVGGAP